MKEKNTEELLNSIKKAKSVDSFLKANAKEISTKTAKEYLAEMLDKYSVTKAEVLRQSNISTGYGYQIFDGSRRADREILIRLSFGFPMTDKEINELLRLENYKALDPRSPRDIMVLFALNNNLSVVDLDSMLYEKNEKALGENKHSTV